MHYSGRGKTIRSKRELFHLHRVFEGRKPVSASSSSPGAQEAGDRGRRGSAWLFTIPFCWVHCKKPIQKQPKRIYGFYLSFLGCSLVPQTRVSEASEHSGLRYSQGLNPNPLDLFYCSQLEFLSKKCSTRHLFPWFFPPPCLMNTLGHSHIDGF